MIRKNDILESVRVAAPCHQSWESMEGDERVRHCEACRLNVYNLSEMTRGEAVDLIRRTEGRMCVRYYERTDGTILTRDCPVGLRAIRKRLAYAVSCAVMMFLSVYAYAANKGAVAAGDDEETGLNSAAWRAKQPIVVQKVLNWVHPLKVHVAVGGQPARMMMGGPAAMPPATLGTTISANNYKQFEATEKDHTSKK